APLNTAAALREELSAAIPQLGGHSARAQFVAERPALLHPEVVLVLSDWIPKLIRTDASKARAVADLAHLVARQLDDSESLALALRAKANLFHVSGKNKAAVRCHERARGLFARVGNKTQMARTLSAAIQPLILLGEYDRAYAAAQEASTIFKEDGNEWRLARVELNTGNIFDRQDRFAEALECYERAYRHLWSHRDQDPDAVAVVLHNMAGCYVCLNDFHLAVRTYEEARTFAAQHAMPALVAQADYNIASLHYLRGEYSRSISLLRAAREACEKSGDQYHFALCHLNLSEIYLEMNMGAEAEETGAVAQSAFQRLGMRYEEGKSAVNLAIALSQQEKLEEALAHFEHARVLFLSEKNQVWTSLLDLYQAIALFKQGELDEEARRLATSALGFFKKSANLSKAVLCHLLLSRLSVRAKDLRPALKHCLRALICLRSIESPSLSCQAHGLTAQVLQSLGHSERAVEHYQLAKEFLEQLRSGIRSDELKISFMRDRVEIYEGLVDLCLAGDQRDVREAFGYIEQAKSRSLFDLVTAARGPVSSAPKGDGPIACRIRELRQELNWYQHRVEIEQLRNRDGTGPQLAQLRAEAWKREREVLRLLREHPASEADMPSTNSDGHMGVDRIQAALHPDATILEYFQVRDQLIVALLTRDQLEVFPVGMMADAEALLNRLRFQMAKPRLGADYAQAFESALLQTINHCLQEFYEQLIAPIRPFLRTSHLIVVPHGALHHLPFHALYDGGKYLIDDFTISYAPSASIYTLCHARTANTRGPALILGVPDPAIPAVEAEASAVAQILPDADLVVGEAATTALLAQKGPQSRFLHIATHGYFRQDQPMFSGIRLSDSCLSLYDLYQMKLPVELVTLSGCSTGLNVVSAGDEILGLARGLICAGAQSALLSLWDVQDQSTADFMSTFYERLDNSQSKAQAVRDAALHLRKSHTHPYYWAPFVLVGKNFRN
ncbi:MAG: CHAT domain-containing tetratricopeptide repeat protein, partial [Candidatus Sulfotelmatobacter sp.]